MKTTRTPPTARLLHLVPSALLATLGCASPALDAPGPANAIVVDVPLVTQEEANECGLACLAALAAHHGVVLSPEVRDGLRAAAAQNGGLTGAEMRAALRASRLDAHIVAGTLDRAAAGVYRQIDRGRPLLVMLGTGEDALHATLVTGYAPDDGRLLLLDPRRGAVWVAPDGFEAAWREAGRFALITTPPDDADPAEDARLLALERATGSRLAERLAGDLSLSNHDLATILLILGIIVLIAILV